ncbi:MAG: hypothetical protein AB7P22_18900, partial [Vicinamibacterales bacterium]
MSILPLPLLKGTSPGPLPLEPRCNAPTFTGFHSTTAGDFPLSSADTVAWELVHGVDPVVMSFRVNMQRAEKWLSAAGRTGIDLTIDGRRFKDLRLLKAVQIDPWYVAIRIADRRDDLKFVRYFGRHNLRIKSQDRKRLNSNRDDLRTFSQERYRQWSLASDGRAWTAKRLSIQVLMRLLAKLGQAGFNLQSAAALRDNGVVPDANEFLGATVDEALRGM